jgi:putative transposase
MARSLRIQYEGAVYHVSSRGNERKEIFKDELDRKAFLNLLTDSLKTYSVILYCYVLMENHFHFLLETPLANLSEFTGLGGQIFILEIAEGQTLSSKLTGRFD